MTEDSPAKPSVEDVKSDKNQADVSADSKVKPMDPVFLKGEIKIFPDKRLPQYDQGAVKAYKAVNSSGAAAFALVCEKNIVPQSEIVHKYAGITTPHLPKLIACGVVDWTIDLKQRFVFIYEDKLGGRITDGKNPAALGLKPELVISTIFRNILDVVHAMRDKGIAHGNIRVQNIFDGGSTTYENTMLGEMLSTPSGYIQPVLYEPITRALAMPLGRGPVEISDDIYALGVTLATLIRTNEAYEGLSDEEIIHAKMEIGSFNFIVGKSRFSAPILEFLRGTLNDDIDLRWTFDDIQTWMEGRRVNAKQVGSVPALKASRPLDFARQKFLKPQMLGVALPKDPTLAVPLIENGELYLWLNRSIQDKELEKGYNEALIEAKRDLGSSNYADRLSSVMAVVMAPENPIFYRGLSLTPVGFGSLLADAAQTKKDMVPYVDIIQSSIAQFWSKYTPNQSVGMSEAVNKLSNCQRFLSQPQIGSGLERCIYYMSSVAPCFSEKLDQFYVRTAEDYLMAMEKLSGSKNRPEWFLDRHIVAFLSVRDKSIMEPFIPDIAAPEKHRQRLGVVRMFAAIQERDKIVALPGLSHWLCGMLDPIIDRYHDREKRKRIRDQVEKIRHQGNLEKIAAIFSNVDEMQMDMRNYTEVMRYYQALKREYLTLDNELLNNKNFGIEAGKQAAALASGIIAGIVVAIYLIFTMSQGGGKIF